MGVEEWGRMGSWTLIQSHNGVWGKPGRVRVDRFPDDPEGEGWLPESEVISIRTRSRRLDRWFRFWRFDWM